MLPYDPPAYESEIVGTRPGKSWRDVLYMYLPSSKTNPAVSISNLAVAQASNQSNTIYKVNAYVRPPAFYGDGSPL